MMNRLLNRINQLINNTSSTDDDSTGIPADDPSTAAADESVSTEELIQALQQLDIETQQDIIIGLLQPLTPWGTYHKYSATWEKAGFHVLPNMYYSPVPDVHNIPDELWEGGYSLAGVDMNDAQQLDMLENVIPQYIDELAGLPDEATDDPTQFYWNNPMYSYEDPILLHTMVRHFQPEQVLEIGCGFSTLISTRAAAMNENTRVVSIEPYPRPFLSELPDLHELIVEPIQNIPLSRFEELEADDILFIDTSHVVRTGGDVNYIYLEILPRIVPGVLIHIHDIFMPKEYPKAWVVGERRFWNEQYMLQALLMHTTRFEVMYASVYMSTRYPEHFEHLGEFSKRFESGVSIWLRTK